MLLQQQHRTRARDHMTGRGGGRTTDVTRRNEGLPEPGAGPAAYFAGILSVRLVALHAVAVVVCVERIL